MPPSSFGPHNPTPEAASVIEDRPPRRGRAQLDWPPRGDATVEIGWALGAPPPSSVGGAAGRRHRRAVVGWPRRPTPSSSSQADWARGATPPSSRRSLGPWGGGIVELGWGPQCGTTVELVWAHGATAPSRLSGPTGRRHRRGWLGPLGNVPGGIRRCGRARSMADGLAYLGPSVP